MSPVGNEPCVLIISSINHTIIVIIIIIIMIILHLGRPGDHPRLRAGLLVPGRAGPELRNRIAITINNNSYYY